MSDLPYVLAGWLGTAAALAGYAGWIHARLRRAAETPEARIPR